MVWFFDLLYNIWIESAPRKNGEKVSSSEDRSLREEQEKNCFELERNELINLRDSENNMGPTSKPSVYRVNKDENAINFWRFGLWSKDLVQNGDLNSLPPFSGDYSS